MKPSLIEAAQKVVDRWDTPLWKEAEPTAHVIAELREAIRDAIAADGASSRHTGQLRDEQNPSLNEESQTNGS